MAAVTTRSTNSNTPRPNGKSMTSSPSSNRTSLKHSETSVPSIKKPDDDSGNESSKDTTASTSNAPLAPPPKPTQNADNDYFVNQDNGRSHFSKEPNPFENAFGNPSETPGKPALPGVTSLTSPASLLPGNTPGWPGSLRSGPLSPAMLTGPTNNNDYFNSDHHFAGSFPTPNESSLRTGLTPGGGGSMFPQPSPNSQAVYNQLQSGGATPGTLDFHRTAMTARAQSQANNYNLDSKPYHQSNSNQQQDNQDPFSSHQTNDAANGLFMLAQAGGARNAQQQYQLQQQQQQNYHHTAQHEKQGSKNSIVSTMSGSTDGAEDQYSEEETKPQTKSKGKKGSGGKAAQNGKRKTEDTTPSKTQGQKRQRAGGQSMPPDDIDMPDDMDGMDDIGVDGKKMTDEEKRKNFLERNRVAALKCRQRKKQWLANLQQKVEIFSSENDALAATVTQLREEIVGLKTLLLAHKDCPVSQAQGISGMAMQQIAGDTQHYANPYGMAMGAGGPANMQQQNQMAQANMQRS